MITRDNRFLALALLLVSALFAGTIIGVLLITHFTEEGEPPPGSETFQELSALLQKHPDADEIRDALRREDLRVREDYFTRRRLVRVGSFLLLAGLAAVVVCARWYASLDPRTPGPRSLAERMDDTRWLRSRRRTLTALAAIGGLVGAAALAMAVIGGSPALQSDPSEPVEPTETIEAADFVRNWPRFRGPNGMGIVEAGEWPTRWNAKTGENIAWKVAVPLPGNSSPVIWDDRIFLTGADAGRREVLCYSRSSGELLWRTPVPSLLAADDEAGELDVMEQTGYAAPTAATDGRRVYAFFATADLAAIDFSGRIVWARNLGRPDNIYGIAVSPIVHEDKLILQFDRGTMAEDELSSIVALDTRTGDEVWRTDRPVVNSWSTPIIAQTSAGAELITCGAPWVIAYDPDLGTELWRADVLSGDVAPCPVVANDMVFVTNEYAKMAAIRTGGTGDVTETHVAWAAEDGMSDAPSPICDGELFLQVHSSGRATCYDAAEGTLIWEHQFDFTL